MIRGLGQSDCKQYSNWPKPLKYKRNFINIFKIANNC